MVQEYKLSESCRNNKLFKIYFWILIRIPNFNSYIGSNIYNELLLGFKIKNSIN